MSLRSMLWAVTLFVTMFPVAATAGTLTFDFEPGSGYTVGNINNQQLWSKTGPYDAVVSNGSAEPGNSQSLRISNNVTSGVFGDQTFTPQLTEPAGESSIAALNMFTASWMFKSVTASLQEGLFISVNADNGAGARMTWIGLGDDSDGLYLGFYDWNLSKYNPDDWTNPAPWQYTRLKSGISRTEWHTIDMRVVFLNGDSNDLVNVWLDGKPVGSGRTWEDFYKYGPERDGGGGGLSPVNSLLFRAGGNPPPSPVSGFYIDNVTIASAQTPEPGTVGLLLAGIGGMVALARRRRSAR